MSYNKLGFTKGQTLKAEHLNHMEDGIANVSYNDLTDKPFYDETPAPITFDGNIDDKEVLALPDGETLVKVSDTPMSAESLVGGEITIHFVDDTQDKTFPITYDMLDVYEDVGLVIVGDGEVMFVENDGFEFIDGVVLNRGAYFTANDGLPYCTKINQRPTIKTLDSKYLPNMRINITENEDGTWISDKTYAEIETAISNGIIPYCVYYSLILYLDSADALTGVSPMLSLPEIHFSCISVRGTGDTKAYSVWIDNANSVDFIEHTLTVYSK